MDWKTVLTIAGIVLAFLFAGAFAWLALELNNAPEGYEDEEGFHKKSAS